MFDVIKTLLIFVFMATVIMFIAYAESELVYKRCLTSNRKMLSKIMSLGETDRRAKCYCDYERNNVRYKCSELKPLRNIEMILNK